LRRVLDRPAGVVIAAWAGSRLIVALAAAAAETILPRNPNLVGASGGPILTSLTSWDGWWYLGIARNGYHAAPLSGQYHDYAFFPLYPALVRALSLATPALDGLVAVLLANALFLVSLWLLYRLTAEVLDPERALWSCVLLCLFPFSWVFSMAYGESLFLALSLGSLLAAERGWAGWACALAALAGLTRLPGVLLIVPLALILWRRMPRSSRSARWPSWRGWAASPGGWARTARRRMPGDGVGSARRQRQPGAWRRSSISCASRSS
jgi:Gpi18-like mannosyltransferase